MYVQTLRGGQGETGTYGHQKEQLFVGRAIEQLQDRLSSIERSAGEGEKTCDTSRTQSAQVGANRGVSIKLQIGTCKARCMAMSAR